MRKTKVLFIIWGIIVLIIIVLLTVLGFILNHKYEKYKEFEEELMISAEKYAQEELLLESGMFKISLKELKDSGYLEDSLIDDDCDGYVVIENDGKYEYTSYITCSSYTTRDYDKNK